MTSAATQMPVPAPRGRKVAVISSHLDDAILSLGATIAGWTRRGRRVIVVTVLANDPDSPGGPSSWDRSAGFTTSKEAAQSRRGEDARACAILGADPEWLPFGDKEHPRGATHGEIRDALERVINDADMLVAPGYPLTQAGGDHLLVAKLALGMVRRPPTIGLYVEQPYAANRVVRRITRRASPLPLPCDRLLWSNLRPTFSDWRAKHAAIASYQSQHPILGPLLRTRIALYELIRGGEAIAWLRPGDFANLRDRIAQAAMEDAEASFSARVGGIRSSTANAPDFYSSS